MNFGLAFSYPFQDPDWFKKIALTGVIFLIPIVGQLYLIGWMLEIVRRVINNETPILPESVDFGGFIGRGFQGFIINLVYAIPLIIFSLPPSLIAPIGDLVEIDTETMGTITIIISVCCGGLSFIYSILLGFVLPAALSNFVVKGSLGGGFQLGEVFGLIKAAPGAYVLVFLGSIVAGIVSNLGIIVCLIGLLVTIPYSSAIMAHFYGQAYMQASNNRQLV